MAGMTKSELIARLAQRYPQLVAKDAEYAVKMILDAMTQSLLSGHRIEIRGFGSFGLNYRPPRFSFDLALQAPLVVLLFAAFAVGALFGVLALLGTLLRLRRQVALLKKRVPPEEPARAPVPEL